MESKIDDLNIRLKKIESIIEKLQSSILGKIGTYNQNIQSINKEMQTMQKSFSKALNPLITKTRQTPIKKIKKPTKRKTSSRLRL